MSWERLCQHKSRGGMGFRHLRDFNIALLGSRLETIDEIELSGYPEDSWAYGVKEALIWYKNKHIQGDNFWDWLPRCGSSY